MAWSVPRTWSAGELVTASIMNNHVRDNFNAFSTQSWTWGGQQTFTNEAIFLGSGPHAIGAAAVDYIRLRLDGSFTSGGGSSVAVGTSFDGRITGASGDTTALRGAYFTNNFTTQGAAEVIAIVAQVQIDEPNITIGTATITNAVSLYVSGAPTEGVTNYGLWVDGGRSRFDGIVWSQNGFSGATASTTYDEFVAEGSAHSGITILSGSTSFGGLLFGDSGDADNGGLLYDHANVIMYLRAAGVNGVSVKSNGLAISALGKFFLDGSGQNGDTYIYENASNRVTIVCGGTSLLRCNGSTGVVEILNSDLTVSTTKKLFFDSAGHTSISETAADRLDIIVGDDTMFRLDENASGNFAHFLSSDVNLDSGFKIFFDSGGDTYIYEVSANQISLVVGGATMATWAGAAVKFQQAYTQTSGSAANVVVTSDGSLKRSTSARRYKEDITGFDITTARELLAGVQGVFYRGKEDEDKRQHIGLIAEDMAGVDARWVDWTESDLGGVPDNVAYARMVAPLAMISNDQDIQIAELKARITQLERKAA